MMLLYMVYKSGEDRAPITVSNNTDQALEEDSRTTSFTGTGQQTRHRHPAVDTSALKFTQNAKPGPITTRTTCPEYNPH